MYLYDLTTGKMKNQITTGEGNVTQVLHVDEKARVIYFLGVGKEKGRDPYFSAYYSVGFDGKNLKLLTPEDADHAVTPSPDGRFFVDVYSTVTKPQVAVLRDAAGEDCSAFGASGYFEAAGFRMGCAYADYGEGAGWEDGPLRLYVQADEA